MTYSDIRDFDLILQRTLFFNVVSSKFNALAPTFLKLLYPFAEVIFFEPFKIVVYALHNVFV
jgi:hypothetical protein